MLDVSIRIGVLNLMQNLRQKEHVSFLYITHDIASARYVADRIMVMYAAKVVEEGPTEEYFSTRDTPTLSFFWRRFPTPMRRKTRRSLPTPPSHRRG